MAALDLIHPKPLTATHIKSPEAIHLMAPEGIHIELLRDILHNLDVRIISDISHLDLRTRNRSTTQSPPSLPK